MTAEVRLERLSAGYPGFRLGPIDLAVDPGEVVAVLGPNGSGKTTLLRTLAGLAPVLGGRILTGGRETTETPPEGRRAGYVPQGLSLFPHRTVAANVGFAVEVREGRRPGAEVSRLLERFGIARLATRRPHQLSGGERQRVAMARAVASRPELLLWDEPLSAVDIASRDDLVDLIRSVTSEDRIPLFLVTHDPSVAHSVAERFLVLDRGRLRFRGTPEEFLRTPPDPFSARFAGYENVLSNEDLARPALEAWGRTVAGTAGPGGLCFSASSVHPAGLASAVAIPGVVRRTHPEPDGTRVSIDVGTVRLHQRLPSGAPVPSVGATAHVTISAEEIRPIASGRHDGTT